MALSHWHFDLPNLASTRPNLAATTALLIPTWLVLGANGWRIFHFFARRSCVLIGNEGTAQLLLAIRLLKLITIVGWVQLLYKLNFKPIQLNWRLLRSWHRLLPIIIYTPYHPPDLPPLCFPGAASFIGSTYTGRPRILCSASRNTIPTAVLLQKYHPAIVDLLRLLR